jgi:FkbM family methyltransferase
MRKNFELNPFLKPRIEIVENALWDKSGNTMSYSENGPATRLGSNNPNATDTSVMSVTIDDLVKTKKLPRMDFIKMDVEGAELAALKGAEHTLRRFKPKLAICVYHRLEDFFDIPDYLASLQLGYRFFLRHFTIHIDETVLFATVN